MADEHGRSVKLDGEAVKRLRIAKGWRVEDLARKAKCSVRTVENVERGAKVYLFTLNKFAEALCVECASLMAENATVPPEPPPARFGAELKLPLSFEDFDESDQLVRFIKLLAQLLPAKFEIVVRAVREGSVVITLDVSVEDLARLLLARDQAAIGELGIESVQILLDPQGDLPADPPVSQQLRAVKRLLRKEMLLKALETLSEELEKILPADSDDSP